MVLGKRISITKTSGEWEIITNRMRELDKPDLSSFLRGEIIKLKQKTNLLPEAITHAEGERIEKKPCIPETMFADLRLISVRMKIPVSSVIDQLIIMPLLTKK